MNFKTVLIWVAVLAAAYILWNRYGSRIRESI